MEKSPWYKNVDGPFPEWEGATGVKADGGGCTRGQGKVGGMDVHRAVFNQDAEGAGPKGCPCSPPPHTHTLLPPSLTFRRAPGALRELTPRLRQPSSVLSTRRVWT